MLFQNIFAKFARCLVSATVLIAVNLIPLVGVLFYDWNQSEILLIYWGESAIIGFYTILKICFSKRISEDSNIRPSFLVNALGHKLFVICFFIFHFGTFMNAHLVFLFLLPINILSNILNSNIFYTIFNMIIAFLALFISHGISFLINYLGKKEYEHANATSLMTAPYSRVMVMHCTVLFGSLMGAPIVILILGKIVFDLLSHVNERKK